MTKNTAQVNYSGSWEIGSTEKAALCDHFGTK